MLGFWVMENKMGTTIEALQGLYRDYILMCLDNVDP